MKYKVSVYHHRKAIIKGDLEAETVLMKVDYVNTKKALLEALTKESKAFTRGYTVKLNKGNKNTLPSLWIFTGVNWIHENTGEKEEEYYYYKVEKA